MVGCGCSLGELVARQGRVCWWRSGIVWDARSEGQVFVATAVTCLV